MIFAFAPIKGFNDIPGRVVGANITYEWLVYIIAIIPVTMFLYGLWTRIKVWRLAQGELRRNDEIFKRVVSLVFNGFGQAKVVKITLAGWSHFFLFWGFLFLFLATVIEAMETFTGFNLMVGNLYIGISWFADVFGFLALIGVGVLVFIRFIQKPDRLNDSKAVDGWVLMLIGMILITGYVLEGARIAAQIKQTLSIENVPYEQIASPIGWQFAKLFVGTSVDRILICHRLLWWLHMGISFLFIGLIPYTKLWHMITGMLNYFFCDLGPSANRMVGNLEEAESFGVDKIEEFAWKDLLDLDACIRCGRCQENCPAYNTGKSLNPKLTIIQAMKKHLDQKVPYLMNNINNHEAENPLVWKDTSAENINSMQQSLIYDVVTSKAIWECTNCRACVEHCPMSIEHIPKILEMRRNLVMWQGEMPVKAHSAFTKMERNYNPWGMGWSKRAGWLEKRGVRDMVKLLPEDDQEFDYLLYAGCAVSFDYRYQKVGESLVKLLNTAGVSIGYLGTQEYCCGDSARRLGNEYLYQTLAAKNIESFNHHGVKKIIVFCPHCYNTLKNEYPQMGGKYEVYHYTEILAQLLKDGRIKPVKSLGAKVSYHDSCFIGRHNGIYDQPRDVIKAAGGQINEIEKSRNVGFCCGGGGGGGLMWLEEKASGGHKRMNDTRVEQLLASEPDMIVTNCPMCFTMISDGLKKAEKQTKIYDVAEVLWKSIN